MKKILFATLLAVLCVGVHAKEATTKYELALINAAKEGNAAQVRGLLEAGTDPNVTDKDGNTPLIYAAKENLASVDMLLFAGADVNARGENGITALINSFSIVTPEAKKIRERLLKAKPDVNAVMYIPQGQLHLYDVTCGEFAIYYRHNKQARGSAAPIYGSATALSFAVTTDDISAVETLLKNGADVNIGLMHPVLHTAVYSNKPNSTKIVELLLNAGANPWQGGENAENALRASQTSGQIADRGGKQKLIKTTMSSAKKQHKLDGKLHDAAKQGDLKQVKKLLEQGADPNSHYGEKYETPLIAATHTKDGQSVEVVKTLLEAGADVNARNRSYSTALYCDYDRNVEKTKLLLKAGADVNVRNMYGNTPLFSASFDDAKAQILLNAGADAQARNYEGFSALFYSFGNNNLLQKHGVKLTSKEQKRLALEKQVEEQTYAEIEAEGVRNSDKSGLGNTLLQGLLNAAQDTANFAIQNAGKF